LTLLNLRRADGRGRFSGTIFSSELARHGGHSLRSLHRGAAGGGRASTATTVAGGIDAATSPPPAAPITTHAAAVATHARRSPSALQITITATDLERRLAIAAGLAGHDAIDLEREVATYHGVVVVFGGSDGCVRRAEASLTGAGGLREQLMEETAMLVRVPRASGFVLRARRAAGGRRDSRLVIDDGGFVRSCSRQPRK
jgi:hypothetical protein